MNAIAFSLGAWPDSWSAFIIGTAGASLFLLAVVTILLLRTRRDRALEAMVADERSRDMDDKVDELTRIRREAQALFLERGYAGTTTKAIAAAAEVSEKTVFLSFPGKAALLAEIIRWNVRGDAPDERVVESAPWRAMLALPSDELLPRFADLLTQILERTALRPHTKTDEVRLQRAGARV